MGSTLRQKWGPTIFTTRNVSSAKIRSGFSNREKSEAHNSRHRRTQYQVWDSEITIQPDQPGEDRHPMVVVG